MLSPRDNYIRAVTYGHPEWVPVNFDLNTASWQRYGGALEEIVLRHPRIFPDYAQGSFRQPRAEPFATAGQHIRDDWGCLWHNAQAGMLGQVVEHPLADWRALAHFRPPDPRTQIDWRGRAEQAAAERRQGRLVRGWYDFLQGGFFDRLQFLRGLENLLVDFLTEPPQLATLIDMVLEYNLECIRRWLAIGIDELCAHGDIATQRGLLFSPATFRKHLKPAYREMFSLCRQAGVLVYYSCDGRLLELVDDLIECGVTLHDPQVRANTLLGIAATYKGRLCAMVDIDEQMMPFCRPEELRQQVQEVMETMGAPEGGLMLMVGPSHDTPLENIEALCDACEEYCW